MLEINATVLMSDACNFSTKQPINPYYISSTINCEKVIQEHEQIQTALSQAGIKIINVPSPTHCQDGVYTANWALINGNTAVLANLPNARQDEQMYAEKILTGLGKKVIHVPNSLKFSGQGDALPCGEYLFCGSGYRSDQAAQKIAADSLGYKRVQLQTIPLINDDGRTMINAVSGWPDSYFYDIDLALAIIKPPKNQQKGLIAYCPQAFTPTSRKLLNNFSACDKIRVSIDEARGAFATNLVSTGKTVIMSADAPKLAAELRRYGLTTSSPIITELAKGGGYIRCVTLTL